MEHFWCGTEVGFQQVLEAKAQAAGFMAAGKSSSGMEMPSLYQLQGDVGVVNISGPLVAGDAGFMQFFGITGYDNIRSALVQAANDKKAKSIMLSINSGGGSVSGVSDTSKFISAVSLVKPVTAYADTAASAAYWLASSAKHITAADTGIVGSIGVLRVHTEYSKAQEKEGVTTTVLRAGKYKTLLNPFEPLTDDAKAQVDGMLQSLYESFVGAVADNRGVSAKVVDSKMAQGKEFLGSQALSVGLVDKVGTYEDALAYAASLGNSANQKPTATNRLANASVYDNNSANSTQGQEVKPTLNSEQLLAISAGIAETPEVIAAATAATTETTEATTDGSATTEIVTDAASAELVAVQAELSTTKTQLAEAQAAVETGKQAAIDAGKTIDGFAAIVSASTKSMLIALGGKVDAVAAMSPTELLAEHERVSTAFKAKIKAGGVAASSAVVEDKPAAKAAVNPMFAAMVKNVPAK